MKKMRTKLLVLSYWSKKGEVIPPPGIMPEALAHSYMSDEYYSPERLSL